MESIVVAIITGIVTLVGVIMSKSKSRAVMEVKIDALRRLWRHPASCHCRESRKENT